jgi:hypothetical protein
MDSFVSFTLCSLSHNVICFFTDFKVEKNKFGKTKIISTFVLIKLVVLCQQPDKT